MRFLRILCRTLRDEAFILSLLVVGLSVGVRVGWPETGGREYDQNMNHEIELLKKRVGELEGRQTGLLERSRVRLDLHGYLRLRWNGYANFDLDSSKEKDNLVRFSNVRSYLTLDVTREPFNAVFSLDLAGSEFDDGVILGNDQPPLGPAGVRNFGVNVQYLYLKYKGFVHVTIGRQPASLGHGIVTHITRDALKVSRRTGLLEWTGIYVIGGEGNTRIDPASIAPRVENSANGKDENLEAFLLIANMKPSQNLRLQAFFAQQLDTSNNGRFPQKRFFDLNGDVRVGNSRYAFELAYEGGKTPETFPPGLVDSTTVAIGPRRDNRAFFIYLNGGYDLSMASRPIEAGLSLGLGSGDNNPSNGKQENFENLFMDETGFHYTFLFSDDIHGFTGRTSDLGRGSGFANILFLQPHLRVYPVSQLVVIPSYTYLRSTKAQPKGTGPLGPGPLEFGPAAEGKTHDAGQELDLLANYTLNEGVNLLVGAGYFIPGAIYGDGADRAWKIETGIEFRF